MRKAGRRWLGCIGDVLPASAGRARATFGDVLLAAARRARALRDWAAFGDVLLAAARRARACRDWATYSRRLLGGHVPPLATYSWRLPGGHVLSATGRRSPGGCREGQQLATYSWRLPGGHVPASPSLPCLPRPPLGGFGWRAWFEYAMCVFAGCGRLSLPLPVFSSPPLLRLGAPCTWGGPRSKCSPTFGREGCRLRPVGCPPGRCDVDHHHHHRLIQTNTD